MEFRSITAAATGKEDGIRLLVVVVSTMGVNVKERLGFWDGGTLMLVVILLLGTMDGGVEAFGKSVVDPWVVDVGTVEGIEVDVAVGAKDGASVVGGFEGLVLGLGEDVGDLAGLSSLLPLGVG